MRPPFYSARSAPGPPRVLTVRWPDPWNRHRIRLCRSWQPRQRRKKYSARREIRNLPFDGATIEDAVSARTIRRVYCQRTGHEQEVVLLARRAAEDPDARVAFEEFGKNLGLAMRATLADFAHRLWCSEAPSAAPPNFSCLALAKRLRASIWRFGSRICLSAPRLWGQRQHGSINLMAPMATCLSNPDVAPVSALRFRAPVAILFACFACRAIAQPTSACHAPQALESGVHAEPTARNWAALAGWFAEQNKFSCAIPAFRQALRIDPSSARLHYFLGLSLSSTGNNAESLVELRRSIQLDGSALNPACLKVSCSTSQSSA